MGRRKILHDPALYVDPMAFNLERFIASPGKAVERDPRDFAFGFGRRYDSLVWFVQPYSLLTLGPR